MTGSSDAPLARNPQSAAFGASIDPADVARFSAQAADWWDPRGPFAPLHRFNPARLRLIRDRAAARFGRDARGRAPFQGLRLLDIGCGGGLVAEPMRRLGFEVVAIDASDAGVGAARAHAAQVGLDIDYRAATVEQLIAEGAGPFDVVLALEVVEHVADPAAFLAACAGLVAPGGLMLTMTLNRTLKSLALGKAAAEYVLRWVPAGTHDWRQFLKPDEVSAMLQAAGLTTETAIGLAYDPLRDAWSQSADVGVNYMVAATRG